MGLTISVIVAILATSSMTVALYTELSPSLPKANTPWLLTRTPGTSRGFKPSILNFSMMTSPVFFSYSPSISSRVKERAQGMSP